MTAHVYERLSAFLDEELPDADRADVDLHLESCPECAQRLAELRAVDALALTLSGDAEPGPDLSARVRARLEKSREASRPRSTPWWWAAAAAVVLSVVPWMIVREAPPSESSRPVTGEKAAAPEKDAAKQAAPAPAAPKVQLAPPPQTRKGLSPSFNRAAKPAPVARDAKKRTDMAPIDGALEDAGSGEAFSPPAPAAAAPEPREEQKAERSDTGRVRAQAGFAGAPAASRRQGAQDPELAAIDAAAEAYQRGRRPEDLRRLRALADEYLRAPERAGAAHVRELLAAAGAEESRGR